MAADSYKAEMTSWHWLWRMNGVLLLSSALVLTFWPAAWELNLLGFFVAADIIRTLKDGWPSR